MKNTAQDASGTGPKWVMDAGRLRRVATISAASRVKMIVRWVVLFMRVGFRDAGDHSNGESRRDDGAWRGLIMAT